MEIIVWKVDLNQTSAEAKETPGPSVSFRVLFPPFFFFFFFFLLVKIFGNFDPL